MRIKALAIPDEGNYTCYMQITDNNRVEANRTVFSYRTSKIGEQLMFPCMFRFKKNILFLIEKPLILESESSSDMSTTEGDRVILRCNATGRPQPTIIWRRQGNAVLPGGGVVHLVNRFLTFFCLRCVNYAMLCLFTGRRV